MGKWIECKKCGGDGFQLQEKAVIDYENGGYLKEIKVDCEHCSGMGEVLVEDE
tara:strand:+ start:297 stop:455 length:159 start_codon:yes stop_codon:yes gene_type:complete